jgi:hypothetical protein
VVVERLLRVKGSGEEDDKGGGGGKIGRPEVARKVFNRRTHEKRREKRDGGIHVKVFGGTAKDIRNFVPQAKWAVVQQLRTYLRSKPVN